MTTSVTPPEDAAQEAARFAAVPLRERPRDWFFVVAFALFASTSFLSDTVNLVGRPDPHSGYFIARFLYNHGGDSLLIANPRFVQITVGYVSALLFGAFYLVLIYAFVRGRDWIRLPAVFYAGMIVMGTGLYLSVGLLGDAPLFQMACGTDAGFDYQFVSATQSLALNLPYPIVALLLVARMWRPRPVGQRCA
jgi:EXPERA (EXPanded EBP superfamily)